MITHRGHAVVIGAGMAGLLTARVLGDAFDQVTILERDHLTAEPRTRPGVPQGRHAHALQARGANVIEELLPGIRGELRAAGAPIVDFCLQARLRLPSGCPPPVASGITIQCFSRPLLETTVRRRVTAIPTVRVRDRCAVTGLQVAGDRITGVHLNHGNTALPADLVVDASGRTSHLPDWLADLGLPRPAESTVDARIGYATRLYHAGPGGPAGWLALFEPLHARDARRGCFALTIENHQLLVTLQGADGDHPPGDEDGFTAFMASLRSDIADTVTKLRPATGIVKYGRTANHRRHYHRLNPWPDGLIAVGDAVCVLNPVYAQGMAVAALQARALRTILTHHPNGFAKRYQRTAARITNWPWTLATIGDRGWHRSQPPLVRAARWYVDRWWHLIPTNPRMFTDFIRLTNMLAGPAILLHPRHVTKVLAPR